VPPNVSAQNVLVTYSGNAKLVDFGCKATASSAGVTQAGEIKGKFAYMAPEQVTGDVVDRRTDIFGMGVILYLLTTGRHPFKGVHTAETLQNICSKRPPRLPSAIIPGYPPELEAVVLKSLAKDPNDRWPTANDMLFALEKAMPQSLDGSFEVQVADYMNELLGDRVRERRMQLRVAQEQADRARPEGLSSPGSYGSLRALTVGAEGGTGTGTHSSASARLLVDPLAGLLAGSGAAAGPLEVARERRRGGDRRGGTFALVNVHWGPPGRWKRDRADLAPVVAVPACLLKCRDTSAGYAVRLPPPETAEAEESAPKGRNVVVPERTTTARSHVPRRSPLRGAPPAAPGEAGRRTTTARRPTPGTGSFGGRRRAWRQREGGS
jgi:hypothetical protein